MMNSKLLSQRAVQPGTFNTGSQSEDIFVKALVERGVRFEQNPCLFKEAGIWSFKPDFLIDGNKIVEMKFQGARGNAHERSYKAYMPGLIEVVKPVLGLKPEDDYPMYTIFSGEMIKQNYVVKQIEQNFDRDKYFFWDRKPDTAKFIIDRIRGRE